MTECNKLIILTGAGISAWKLVEIPAIYGKNKILKMLRVFKSVYYKKWEKNFLMTECRKLIILTGAGISAWKLWRLMRKIKRWDVASIQERILYKSGRKFFMMERRKLIILTGAGISAWKFLGIRAIYEKNITLKEFRKFLRA